MPDNQLPTLHFDSKTLYYECRSAETAIQAAAYRTLWAYLYRVTYQLVRHQPDSSDLAQDCAQQALVRIHQRLLECLEPNAFRSWARRIATNLTIDELRRRRRLTGMTDEAMEQAENTPVFQTPSAEKLTMAALSQAELHELLNSAPISERSRRVVGGRYLDDIPDETLAQVESELSHTEVLPSHVQVTRAKNLAKLRHWEPLQHYLKPESSLERT